MNIFKERFAFYWKHREAIIGVAMIFVLAIAAMMLAEIFVEHFIR